MLSLPSFFMEVLVHYKISPCQLIPNSWRILLGFQVLREVEKVNASLEAFWYTYTLSSHKFEKGRISIGIRSGMEPLIMLSTRSDDNCWKGRYLLFREDCIFGPKGPGKVPLFWQFGGVIENDFPDELIPSAKSQLEDILGIPWSERRSSVLLSPEYLAKTNIWSACIALSKLEVTDFIEKFEAMEKSRVRTALRIVDLCAGGALKKKAKRVRKSAIETSMVPINLSNAVPSSRVTPRKGKAIESVQPPEGCKQVGLGKGIGFSMDPSSFWMEGNFKLTKDIDCIREEGMSRTIDYAISLAAREFQAMVAIIEDISSFMRGTRQVWRV